MTAMASVRPDHAPEVVKPGDIVVLVGAADGEEYLAPVPSYCPVCGKRLGDTINVRTTDGLSLTTECPRDPCGVTFTVQGGRE